MFGFGKKKLKIDDALDLYVHVTLSIVDQSFDEWKEQFFEALSIIEMSEEELQSINHNSLRRIVEVASLAYAFLPVRNLFKREIADLLESRFEIRLRAMVPGEANWIADEVYRALEFIRRGIDNSIIPNTSVLIYICKKAGINKFNETDEMTKQHFFLLSSSSIFTLKVESFWKTTTEDYRIVP